AYLVNQAAEVIRRVRALADVEHTRARSRPTGCRQTSIQHTIEINTHLVAIEYSRDVMPRVGCDSSSADRRRVLVMTLIQIQSQLTGVRNRQLITATGARLSPRFATDDVLIVSVDRAELDPRFDRDWTTDIDRGAVRHAY